MSVHSLFRYFQLVSAHALSSTAHDSPRKFTKKAWLKAQQFLPTDIDEKRPNSLLFHFEWGLRGPARQQIFPPLKAKAKAKAKARAKASSSLPSASSSDMDELFGKHSSEKSDSD